MKFINSCKDFLNKIIIMLNIQAELNITYETKDVISLELKSVFNKFNSYLSNQNVINLLFEKQSIDMKVLKMIHI